MKLTKTGSQARRSESHTRSPEADKGAVGGRRGGSGKGASTSWPGGLSLAADCSGHRQGKRPCTVQGPLTNRSCGSSDSAPTEASVPVLSLARLPFEVPATGSCPPRVYEPAPTATPRPTIGEFT